MRRRQAISVLGPLILTVAGQGTADASGFALLEQSAKRNGTALAGSGSSASDASAVWFNPAAMKLLGSEMLVAGHIIAPSFDFADEGSVQLTPAGPVSLLPAAAPNRDGGQNAFVPHVSLSAPVGDRWHFGIVLNAPFGLTTDYDGGWKGQYQAVKSEIVNLNLNPAMAFELSDSVTVGAGISVNYVDAELTNVIDFAAVCAELAGGACPNGAAPGQGQFDGFVSSSGDSTEFGFNAGILLEFGQATRLGLAYRSEIDHELEGTAEFTAPDTLGGFDALGPILGGALSTTFRNTTNRADLTLPATATASLYHRFGGGRLAVMLDAEWTGWSSLDRLRIEFSNPATPASEEILDWEDVWRYSLGVEYDVNDRWTIRAGTAFDETPVKGPTLRTARIPTNDRTWLAGGVTWRWSESAELDVALAHTFLDDTDIDRTGSTGDRLVGVYESESTIVSVAAGFRF